jgi:hypothetical protein
MTFSCDHFNAALDLCPVNFDKHSAILLHSSPFVKSIPTAFLQNNVQQWNQRGKILFDSLPYGP